MLITKKISVLFFISFLFLNSCSIVEQKSKQFSSSSMYEFNYKKWLSNVESDTLILAIHGYNAHAGSFEAPAKFLTKFDIDTISFDLRGFGTNENIGNWFPLDVHVSDVEQVITDISQLMPQKKIYLLGESMGGAIVISLVVRNKNLPIEGLILVSPAFWNFSEMNPFKSLVMKAFSNLFPKLRIGGGKYIKVRPSDNIEMLKDYSIDPLVIHEPTTQSLNGIIQLMDTAYKDSKIFLKKPSYQTLLIIPVMDEIVPRKPLLNLLENPDVYENLNNNLYLAVYDKNFHMILRDNDGDRISREIKEWITNKKNVTNLHTFINPIQRLKNSEFYHKLD